MVAQLGKGDDLEYCPSDDQPYAYLGPRDRIIVTKDNGITEEKLAEHSHPGESLQMLKDGLGRASKSVEVLLKTIGFTDEMENVYNRHTHDEKLPDFEKARRNATDDFMQDFIFHGDLLEKAIRRPQDIRRSTKLRDYTVKSIIESLLHMGEMGDHEIAELWDYKIRNMNELNFEQSMIDQYSKMRNSGFIFMEHAIRQLDVEPGINMKDTRILAAIMAEDKSQRIVAYCEDKFHQKPVPVDAPKHLTLDMTVVAIKVRGEKSEKYPAEVRNDCDSFAIKMGRQEGIPSGPRFIFKGVSTHTLQKILKEQYITPGGMEDPRTWSFFSGCPIGSRLQLPGGQVFLDSYDHCMAFCSDEMELEGYNIYLTIPEGDFVTTKPVWFRYCVCIWNLKTGKWDYLRPYAPFCPGIREEQKRECGRLIAGTLLASLSKDNLDTHILGEDWQMLSKRTAEALCKVTDEDTEVWIMKINTFHCPYCYFENKVGSFDCEKCSKAIANPEFFVLQRGEEGINTGRPVIEQIVGYGRKCHPDWKVFSNGLDGHFDIKHVWEVIEHDPRRESADRYEKNKADYREAARALIHVSGRLNGDLAGRMIHAAVYRHDQSFRELEKEGKFIDFVVANYSMQLNNYKGGRVSLITGAQGNEAGIDKKFFGMVKFPIKLGIAQDKDDQELVNKHRNENRGRITNIFEWTEQDSSRFDNHLGYVAQGLAGSTYAKYQMMAGSRYAQMLKDMKDPNGIPMDQNQLEEYKRKFAIETMPLKPFPRKSSDCPIPIEDLPDKCYYMVSEDFNPRAPAKGKGSKRAASRGPRDDSVGPKANQEFRKAPAPFHKASPQADAPIGVAADAKGHKGPGKGRGKSPEPKWRPKVRPPPDAGEELEEFLQGAAASTSAEAAVPIQMAAPYKGKEGKGKGPVVHAKGGIYGYVEDLPFEERSRERHATHPLDRFPCCLCGDFNHQGRMCGVVGGEPKGKGKPADQGHQRAAQASDIFPCHYCLELGRENSAYSHYSFNCRNREYAEQLRSQGYGYDDPGEFFEWPSKGKEKGKHKDSGNVPKYKGPGKRGGHAAPYEKGGYRAPSNIKGKGKTYRPVKGDGTNPDLMAKAATAATLAEELEDWRSRSTTHVYEPGSAGK